MTSVTRTAPVPFARPSIGPEEIAAVVEVLESGWITTGERTRRFESDFRANQTSTTTINLIVGTKQTEKGQ